MESGNTKTKAKRAAQLRYKQPALAPLGRENLINELYDIQEACNDVHWFLKMMVTTCWMNPCKKIQEEKQ